MPLTSAQVFCQNARDVSGLIELPSFCRRDAVSCAALVRAAFVLAEAALLSRWADKTWQSIVGIFGGDFDVLKLAADDAIRSIRHSTNMRRLAVCRFLFFLPLPGLGGA